MRVTGTITQYGLTEENLLPNTVLFASFQENRRSTKMIHGDELAVLLLNGYRLKQFLKKVGNQRLFAIVRQPTNKRRYFFCNVNFDMMPEELSVNIVNVDEGTEEYQKTIKYISKSRFLSAKMVFEHYKYENRIQKQQKMANLVNKDNAWNLNELEETDENDQQQQIEQMAQGDSIEQNDALRKRLTKIVEESGADVKNKKLRNRLLNIMEGSSFAESMEMGNKQTMKSVPKALVPSVVLKARPSKKHIKTKQGTFIVKKWGVGKRFYKLC